MDRLSPPVARLTVITLGVSDMRVSIAFYRGSGYFSNPDGHRWEVVVAPGIEVGEDRRVRLPD